MVAQLLLEAANLMFIGMGAVFAFLLLLVFIVQLISAFMLRYFPVKLVEKANRIDAGSSSGTSPAIVAAIAAAVHQHRQKQ